jgi:hypothetical protein
MHSAHMNLSRYCTGAPKSKALELSGRTSHVPWLQHIWSQTHLIPGLLAPHFLSPLTNDPHKIDPPGQTVPIKFGPHGQTVPIIWSLYFQIPTACPPGQTEYSRDHLSRGTKLVGDHLSMGTELVGDHLS